VLFGDWYGLAEEHDWNPHAEPVSLLSQPPILRTRIVTPIISNLTSDGLNFDKIALRQSKHITTGFSTIQLRFLGVKMGV